MTNEDKALESNWDFLILSKKGGYTMQEQFFVGIDVAKRFHKVAIINNTGSLIKNFSILNSKDGINLFVQNITSIGPIDNFIVGMEATGHYWFGLYYSLKNLSFNVAGINPAQTNAFTKMRIRKTKTDKVDANSIAQLLRFGKYSVATVPNESCFKLRELSRFRFKLTDLIKILKLKLIRLIDIFFPEFGVVFSNMSLKTPIAFLEKYPSPASVINASTESIAKFMSSCSKGRWKFDKALAIKKSAQDSFGLSIASDIYNLEITCIIELIRAIDSKISIVEQEITKIMDDLKSPITTIKGIGIITGASVLGEVADISRFKSPKQLIAFSGLDPSVYQTGEFQGSRMKISKRGSTFLRYSIWQAAVSARRFNKDLANYYEKKKKEGKHTNVATTAVARKLLCIIWRIMKDNRPYYEDRSLQAK